MQALKECHAYVFLEQFARLLNCMLSAYPISTHNALFAVHPCFPCTLSLFFQHLLLMPARLHATRPSDPRPGVTSCCCARLLLPGIWHGHGNLGACDLGSPVGDVRRWRLQHCSGHASLIRACDSWGVRTLRCRAQRSEPCPLLVVQPPGCCRAGMGNSSPSLHGTVSLDVLGQSAGTCESICRW